MLRHKLETGSGSWPWSFVALCLVVQCFLFFQFRLYPSHRGTPEPTSASCLEDTNAHSSDEHDATECTGRRIFVYEYLPRSFHEEIINSCAAKCTGSPNCDKVCKTLENGGLGIPLNNTEAEDKYGDTTPYTFPQWFYSHGNTAAVLFRSRMKMYDCLTTDWSKADAFYIPALVGLESIYKSKGELPWKEIEALGDELETFLSYQPGFIRRGGRDHFIVVGQRIWDFLGKERTDPTKGWVWTSFMFYRPSLSNLTWISPERIPWDHRSQSIPYVTAFHPKSDSELQEWVEHARWHPRKVMAVVFTNKQGNSNSEIQEAVEKLCWANPNACKVVDCSGEEGEQNCEDPRNVAKEQLSATYCLVPAGSRATERITFDAMVAGCIPVVFDENSFEQQYLWHKGEAGQQKIFFTFNKTQVIDGSKDFLSELSQVPEENTARMREDLLSLVPGIVYRDHSQLASEDLSFRDSFDVTVEAIVQLLKAG